MTLTEDPRVQSPARDDWPETDSRNRLWRKQRRGATLAAVAVVAGLLIGLVASMLVTARTPVYSSRAVLLMDQPGAISLAQGDGVVLKLSRLRLKYVGLAGTQAINTSVGRTLHVPASSLAGLVTANAPGDNLNIVITSQTKNKAQAVPLTAATATALVKYVDNEQSVAKIAPNLRLHLTLIQPASAVSASGAGDHRQAVVGIAAGVLAAAAVAAFGLLRR